MRLLKLGLALTMLLSLVACSERGSDGSYKDNVHNALEQADLKDISVAEDRDHNTITLTGKLHSQEAKDRAGQIAQSSAPGRIIANEISFEPLGNESAARKIESNLDDAIEDTYKAALISNHLDKGGIRYDSKNGVLTLKGTVKDPAVKQEAQQVASTVPNVAQVVNQIEVRR
jgi:osmotically-inducible protein OsmY